MRACFRNHTHSGRPAGGLLILLTALAVPAGAQIPRINTFFPIGGKAGSTVELEIRGSSLDGANKLLVSGSGVIGTVEPSGSKTDEQFRPIWQNKCGTCHELRSPANRSMSPQQWAATVERMVKVRQAPISSADAEKITQYLSGAAKSGKLVAHVKISPDALPGLCELRVVTPKGVSTAALFEIGNLPEIDAVSNTRNTPMQIALPCVVNGTLAGNAERHYFRFQAKGGQRLVFNLKGFRYNLLTQLFFNPNLRLYDSSGKQIAENHGYYELDPLIDWTCPADGPYTLEVRDLLGRGNPGNVYRLTMGSIPYDTVVYPPAAQTGAHAALNVVGKNTAGMQTAYSVEVPATSGLTQIGSPYGPQPFYVSPYAIVTKEAKTGSPTALPAGFAGRLSHSGEADSFSIQGNGTFEFEAYSTRVGSPGNLRVSLLNEASKGMAGFGGDGRMTAKLEAGKTYTLKVEDGSGQGGPDHIYVVEARPAHPDVECVVRPANITLRPGLSTIVQVALTRREGVTGDVIVSAEGLPSGVIVSPNVIQPDRGEAFLVLTALSTAKPIEKPITIYANAKGPLGETKAIAQPQELVNLNNNLTPINRAECVVAVRGQADFTADIASSKTIKVHPRRGVEVKVHVTRSAAFKGPVNVRITGLPSGWVANQETVQPNKDTVTLLVRPDGNNTQPFMKRDPNMSPIYATVVVSADEFEFVAGTLLVQADPTVYPEDKNE